MLKKQPSTTFEKSGVDCWLLHSASAFKVAAWSVAIWSILRLFWRWMRSSKDSFDVKGEFGPDLVLAFVLHFSSHALASATNRSCDFNDVDIGSEYEDSQAGFAACSKKCADPGSLHDGLKSVEPCRRRESISCGPELFGFGNEASVVDEVTPRLQQLIRKCRSHQEGRGLRIFDDCTIESEGATLSECRSSLFCRIRAVCNVPEDDYYDSLCAKPLSGGKVEVSGKSGSAFLRSYDNRLLIKTIEEHEFEVLSTILPDIVLYLEQHPNSLLSRTLGAYSLSLRGVHLRFIVMENVLRRRADQVYDLKGTTEDRWVNPSPGAVMKDVNFAGKGMSFIPSDRNKLVESLCDDADFLDSIGVMDYSLLVGVTFLEKLGVDSDGYRGWLLGDDVDRDGFSECEFQFGIIDYLQRWTPKKVAAHWLKKATLGCFHEIDTEPPAIYRRRFCKQIVSKISAR